MWGFSMRRPAHCGLVFASLVVATGVLAACGSTKATDSKSLAAPVVVLAAGDIAECEHSGDEATARLLAAHPEATILTLGDNAYQQGTDEDFMACYAPSWGKFKDRTRPSVGNHDQETKDAQGYADYFGSAGGPFDRYYYSFDLGGWHLVVLNSDCWRVGGCGPGSPQYEWLLQDLENHPSLCTLAYWHRPAFTSGRYRDNELTREVRALWQPLYDANAEIILAGHEHSYERFLPMDPSGQADAARGIQEFVVGTGGGNLRPYKEPPLPTTVVRDGSTWGVLKLKLYADRYEWKFLPVEGKTFTDTGSVACH